MCEETEVRDARGQGEGAREVPPSLHDQDEVIEAWAVVREQRDAPFQVVPHHLPGVEIYGLQVGPLECDEMRECIQNRLIGMAGEADLLQGWDGGDIVLCIAQH